MYNLRYDTIREKERGEMICPILSSGKETFINCQQKDCALWEEEFGMCCIKEAAKSVEAMANYVSEIKEKD